MFDNQLDRGNDNVIDLADDAGIGVVTVANDDDEQVFGRHHHPSPVHSDQVS